MAAKMMFQFLIVVLAVFQAVWTCGSFRPRGCNIPQNIPPVTLLQMRGVWYVQGTANTTVPPTNRCIRNEIFSRESGRRGVLLQSYVNSNGIYNTDPIFVNYIRPGVTEYTRLRNDTFTSWDYMIESDADSYLFIACDVRNEETFQQRYVYITRNATVPQQTIIAAFDRAGVEVGSINFIDQTNCLNRS